MAKDKVATYGAGKLTKMPDGNYRYRGSFPNRFEEDVCMINQSDLELLVQGTMTRLMVGRFPMSEENFEMFPDSLSFVKGGVEYNLVLDRHFYAINAKDQIIVRYESIDQAFTEEWDEVKDG